MQCPQCPAIFGEEATLKQHVAAIHGGAAANEEDVSEASASSSEGEGEGEGEVLELEPVLEALTEDQKDLLLMRALQRVPDLADLMVDQLSTPISDDVAHARTDGLSPAAVSSLVRAFLAVEGAEANGAAILRAASASVVHALQELAAAAEWQESAELELVESLPPVGTLAALWAEVLEKPSSLRAGESAAASLELLEQMAEAAASVRAKVPAVLVGPDGGADNLDAPLKQLRALAREAGGASASEGRASRKRKAHSEG